MLKLAHYCATIVLTTAIMSAAPLSQPTSATLTITDTAKIPGVTLKPGPYSIRVVNKLSDRLIVRVDSASDDIHSTFIGIPNHHIQKPSTPGVVSWNNSADGVEYLRGYYFPGATAVTEFVYPKADAVAIANSNQEQVPAIDPASEGRVADPTLSKSDMQLVTLWLLSAERVGPSAASSIKAVRYQQAGYTSPKAPLAALPHTASRMPWVWMICLWSLLAATLLHTVRRSSSQHASNLRRITPKS